MAKLKKPAFKILLYTYKRLASGQHPIMIRVTYDRKQRYFSLGLAGSVENWNQNLERYHNNGKRLTEAQKDANVLLNGFAARMEKAKKHFGEVEFSFDRFDKFFFQSSQNHSVFSFTQSVTDQLITEDRVGSALTYRDTLSRLKKFRKGRDLTFRDIDASFLEDFKKHLMPTNGVNSIGIYFRTLKAIHKRAERKGMANPELSPWIGYRIETEPTRKRALSKEQIQALKDYKTEPGSRHWHSLNCFLFSYFCRGMNFEDMARLTWDDIRNDRIFYLRRKTKDPFDLVIDSRIAQILSAYSSNKNFVFPILCPGLNALSVKQRIKRRLKKVNNDLKEIAGVINKLPESKIAELVMPTDITFYWARHSAATALKRAGVSTAMISEILGHSSEKVTQTYLDSFEKKQLDEIGNYL